MIRSERERNGMEWSEIIAHVIFMFECSINLIRDKNRNMPCSLLDASIWSDENSGVLSGNGRICRFTPSFKIIFIHTFNKISHSLPWRFLDCSPSKDSINISFTDRLYIFKYQFVAYGSNNLFLNPSSHSARKSQDVLTCNSWVDE